MNRPATATRASPWPTTRSEYFNRVSRGRPTFEEVIAELKALPEDEYARKLLLHLELALGRYNELVTAAEAGAKAAVAAATIGMPGHFSSDSAECAAAALEEAHTLRTVASYYIAAAARKGET